MNMLLDYDDEIGALLAMSGGILIFLFAFLVLMVVAYWKIFTKAGKPGWHSIIPFLSTWDLYDLSWNGTMGWVAIALSIVSSIAGSTTNSEDGSGGSVIVGIIGFASLVLSVVQLYKLSLSFGYGVGFTLGLIFLSPIFLLILGFGSAQYMGREGKGGYNPANPYGNQGGYNPTVPYDTQGGYNPAAPYNTQGTYNPADPYVQGVQGGAVTQNPFENGNNNFNQYQ